MTQPPAVPPSGAELMTGLKDEAEHGLPATIDVATLISTRFAEARSVQFTRQRGQRGQRGPAA